MNIEYEATFTNIDKDAVRQKLREIGARLIKPEVLMRRQNYYPPLEKRGQSGWLRVRDEGDRITMSFKANHKGQGIEDQKEICLTVDDYNKAISFLDTILERKAYQETKREMWQLDNVEICLDEWPHLKPFIEIEGHDEADVQAACARLGFDYSQALFCAAGELYYRQYGVAYEDINNKIKLLTFDSPNPFSKKVAN